MTASALPNPSTPPLLHRLGNVVARRGMPELASRLQGLAAWVASDMAAFETELAQFQTGPSLVERTGHHLLDIDGKHLRPMCVLLAAKLAGPLDPRAHQLAVAVELVHSATLLHDDVVDSGDLRRGKPTARVLYGNAASIFAGDWLLVAALRLIRQADSGPMLDRMLAVIDEMIIAESVQLENRGRLNAELGDYFAVVEGKTASLFRWAMFAGASVAGLTPEQCAAVERFGLHLGVAFQAVDDLLDVDGDALATGKTLFADLRDGKVTYPLIVALARRPALASTIAKYCGDQPRELLADDAREVILALRETEAVEECRTLARQRASAAKHALSCIADGPGKQALLTVADTTIHRDR